MSEDKKDNHDQRSLDILEKIEDHLKEGSKEGSENKEEVLRSLDSYFSNRTSDDENTQVVYVDRAPRIESGNVKFVYRDGQEDWTGVFIRGDGAAHYSMMLEEVLSEDSETTAMASFISKSLLEMLQGSYEF